MLVTDISAYEYLIKSMSVIINDLDPDISAALNTT